VREDLLDDRLLQDRRNDLEFAAEVWAAIHRQPSSGIHGNAPDQAAPDRPLLNTRSWPTLTAERSAPFDSNAIHCRRSRHGRLLYVALQLMTAGTWPALDDPKPPAAP
jgi:hypothetical protein